MINKNLSRVSERACADEERGLRLALRTYNHPFPYRLELDAGLVRKVRPVFFGHGKR